MRQILSLLQLRICFIIDLLKYMGEKLYGYAKRQLFGAG